MLNNTVVSLYHNYGLMFEGSEDEATSGIENRSLSTATCYRAKKRQATTLTVIGIGFNAEAVL